jgi:hypothetical protein
MIVKIEVLEPTLPSSPLTFRKADIGFHSSTSWTRDAPSKGFMERGCMVSHLTCFVKCVESRLWKSAASQKNLKNKHEKTALSGGFSKTDILYFVPFNFLGLTRE